MLVPKGDEPYGWVVGAVLQDDADQGYVISTHDSQGKLSGFAPVSDMIAALEPAAADLARRWKAFGEAEPQTLKPLRSHIDTALHGRIQDDEPYERDS